MAATLLQALPDGDEWLYEVQLDQMAEMPWVKPSLVAQIRFVEWTADGHLRHAAFLGLRTDTAPGEVTRP